MPITPEEHRERAAAVGIEWLADPPNTTTPTPARCLTCGHLFTPTSSGAQQGQGCPACCGRLPITPEEHHRRAAAAGLEWLVEPPNTSAPTPARCLKCGHEWSPKPSHVRDGHGCPSCAGQFVTREEYDRRAAALNIEWVGDEPVRSAEPHPARCLTCGHEWRAWPDDVKGGRGCPKCAKARAGEKLRGRRVSLAELNRRAAAAGIEWLAEPADTNSRTPARCLTCGHEWNPTPNRVLQGRGCPACAAERLRRPHEEWNARAAAVGIEWIGDERIHATTPHAARCLTCGHEWSPKPDAVSGGHGCPKCAGMIATPEERAEQAAAVGIEWLEDPSTAREKAPARCLTCGHEWAVRPNSVQQGQGCPACSPRGFDPAAPATVYLVRHERGPVVKVGVTDADKRERLRTHNRRGWETLGTWPVPVGRDALAIEAAVLEWWEDRGAVPCEPEDVPEGDGYTEAVFVTAAAEESATLAYIAEQVEQVGGGA